MTTVRRILSSYRYNTPVGSISTATTTRGTPDDDESTGTACTDAVWRSSAGVQACAVHKPHNHYYVIHHQPHTRHDQIHTHTHTHTHTNTRLFPDALFLFYLMACIESSSSSSLRTFFFLFRFTSRQTTILFHKPLKQQQQQKRKKEKTLMPFLVPTAQAAR